MTRLLAVDLNASRLPQREPYRLLAAKGMQVLLIAPQSWRESFGTAEFEPELDRARYQARSLKVWASGKYHRVLFRGLESAIAGFKPDRIWAHAEPENLLAWQVLRARDRVAPRARVSLVSWRNIDYPRGGLPYRLAGLHQRIEDASRAAGAEVLCYNRDAERIMSARGFSTRPTRMGVNQGYFKPQPRASARRALGLPAKARLYGFAGRFIASKGVADLIDAAARVPGAQLLLLGDGPARGAWQVRAQERGVTLHLRSLGHEQMAQGLAAMDALVLPSRSTSDWIEQFGRILIEAMACGIPVLGSDSGAIPEVIGKAGLTYNEGDVAGLARLLKQLPSKSKALSRAGLRRAKDYEWRAIAPQLARDLGTPQPLAPSAALHGVPVFNGVRTEALTACAALLRAGKGGLVFYLNAHTANLAATEPAYRAALRQADLVLPDGGGVVLAARALGEAMPERLVLGDLLGPLARLAKAGVYFWGAEPGVAQAAAKALGLKLAGCSDGYQADVSKVIAAIRRSRAKLVFVGQGSPRQEQLALRLRQVCPGLLVIVCGNAFTYAAGLQSRAPGWMQAASMEWLWRLIQEPSRLWRRYLLGNAIFVARTFWQRLGGRP